ncbi:FHA domain-containing protein [Amycolatopsis suaedae]|uniref:FHA domain-containing protein n=1 Tax=Amycolatopsis suaedae TaxID=2510978 RepID=A0A4Q7IYN2_9PSEU|nr:FHA domain-containing protein [Amycolatopsis suaedae]RZQ60090.1 FHA domain-containing protein [Amycolatopsis suaedae]
MDVEPDARLPAGHDSLAHGVASRTPGTLSVLGPRGGVVMPPLAGAEVTFGRNRALVAVGVGEEDRRVSRRHGYAEWYEAGWWLRVTGRTPVRLPGSRLLFADAEPVRLTPGYTPLFLRGSRGQEHVLEMYVSSERDDAVRRPWKLTARERLVMTVLGQRYLRCEPSPRPLSWLQAAEHLARLQPLAGWTVVAVERLVTDLRARIPAGTGGDWLSAGFVEPGVIVPPDLALLAPEPGAVEVGDDTTEVPRVPRAASVRDHRPT